MRPDHIVVGDRRAIHIVVALLPRSKSDSMGIVWIGETVAVAIVEADTPRIAVHVFLHSTRADREYDGGSVSPESKLPWKLKFEYDAFKGRLIFWNGQFKRGNTSIMTVSS